jgi:hypothetical protein
MEAQRAGISQAKAHGDVRARHHGGAGFTHDITSGLFAGVRARQVADDPSFGYIAAFLALPQYASHRNSSGSHCALQFVSSQGTRTIRSCGDAGAPAGPGSPEGPGGPAGPCGPGWVHAASVVAKAAAANVRLSCIAISPARESSKKE